MPVSSRRLGRQRQVQAESLQCQRAQRIGDAYTTQRIEASQGEAGSVTANGVPLDNGYLDPFFGQVVGRGAAYYPSTNNHHI